MLLGLRSKGGAVSCAYEIVVHEVKPWPSKHSPAWLLIQWQRGDKRSGVTKAACPDKDKLAFNDSFKIPATLYKLPQAGSSSNSSGKKNGSGDKFQKKCIVLCLFEAGSDRSSPRGQPLGRAVVDLADYGVLNAATQSSVKLAVAKRELTLLGSPSLFFTISPLSKGSSSSNSSSVSSPAPTRPPPPPAAAAPAAASQDEDEEDDNVDIASFTDDDEDDDDRTSSSSAQSTASRRPPVSKAAALATEEPKGGGAVEAVPKTSPRNSSSSSNRASTSRVTPSPPVVSPARSAASAAASSYASRKGTSPTPSRPSSSSDTDTSGEVLRSPSLSSSTPSPSLAKATTLAKEVEGSDREGNKAETNVLKAARMKFAEGAGERCEKLDKRAVEEARLIASNAVAKAAAAEDKARALQEEIEELKGELVDAAALEAALYSVVARHGSSSHKVHSPARRLARVYLHACDKCSEKRMASAARNIASGLVVVARACENDVSRLTFWWSNVLTLRGIVLQASNAPFLPSVRPLERRESVKLELRDDWKDKNTFVLVLERIEAWIFGTIVESIWWQSLTPHMQQSEQSKPLSPLSDDAETPSVVTRLKKSVRGLLVTDFAESRQGSMSIEIWKSAFVDALHRLCPVRAGGHDCGCLKLVAKMVIEQCVARLDVAMFNAVLRDTEESIPTDPVSDPISDISVLPITPSDVSFSGGAQLKNVINTWSTWLLAQTAEGSDDAQEMLEKGCPYFPLLRSTSDLLMLPKDMLMDKSVRKEVCPALSLTLIRRVLSKFTPDEFSPEPVPPSLLAALNAEISMEKQRVGEEDTSSSSSTSMAAAPQVVYATPNPAVALLLDSHDEGASKLQKSASLLRKGHSSEDELEDVESPLLVVLDGSDAKLPLKDASAKRYHLLREALR